ncbi:Protein AIG2 [Tolypocladium ophioglossoides CBS 100239]|uniref:Putative gamma-glutamylcyclotransferase n=1 Tax=Tolypocladium ophioglossoides (strain CBS 100239) TaxID=1163406 RepID=A0A0L0NIV0_TOLOC|nr:Protein AIG2 [Tolypocladium ophioglossoides CBS 100239]
MSGEHTAFFYGTLMAPEVFFSVCYGNKLPPKAIRDLHTFTPAILNDHCRHRVQYADYPAVIPEQGRSVRGVYVTGLTDANVKKLDYFEGSEYERVEAKVYVLQEKDGKEVVGEVKDTSVYIFLVPKNLEKREWDYEEFRRNKMQMWTRGEWALGDGESVPSCRRPWYVC